MRMAVIVVLGLAYGVVTAWPSEIATKRDATSVRLGWMLIVMCLVLAALNSAEPAQV